MQLCLCIESFNNSLDKGIFPDQLKNAHVKPIYKKNKKL